MPLFEELTFGSIAHNGTPVRAGGAVRGQVEAARNRTLYRATLTADLLERREVAELASWAPDGGIRVVPGTFAGNDPLLPGAAFDFETPEEAAAFLRREIVPRLEAGRFDDAIESRMSGPAINAAGLAEPTPAYGLAAE